MAGISAVTIHVLNKHFQLPIEMHDIIMFLSYLHNNGHKYGTWLEYLSAISFNLRMKSLSDYCSSLIVSKFMQEVKNLSTPMAALLPITLGTLESLIGAVPHVSVSDYEVKLLMAIFSTRTPALTVCRQVDGPVCPVALLLQCIMVRSNKGVHCSLDMMEEV